MSIHPLVGHTELRHRLAGAIRTGRLPQALVFVGPAGVGKQRLALWLGQALLCERTDLPGAGDGAAGPCDQCRPCRLAVGLAHPDLHWMIPVARPKAGDPDKAVDEVAEALGELYAARRESGQWGRPDGLAAHGIASVRLLQRQASLTSVEGRHKVFIIGDAEALSPQESSQEAANALLKLLEEPPPATTLILTTSDARRLLPTIRSRTVTVRVEPLSPAEAARVPAAKADEGTDAARTAAAALLDEVVRDGAGLWGAVLKRNPWAARGDFTALLDAVAHLLGDAMRAASGVAPVRPLPPPLRKPADVRRLVTAMAAVEDARAAAQGNVNPQLLLAVLADDLAEALCA